MLSISKGKMKLLAQIIMNCILRLEAGATNSVLLYSTRAAGGAERSAATAQKVETSHKINCENNEIKHKHFKPGSRVVVENEKLPKRAN